MCQVNRCCCFSLKTGCLIIGMVDLLIYIIALVTASVNISNDSTGIPIVVESSLSIIAAVLLIFGVMKENPVYLKFWLIFKGIVLTILCVIFVWIILAVTLSSALQGAEGGEIIVFSVFICIIAVIIGLSIYWWYVVKSYKRVLKMALPK
ncbi:hypothetical protein ACFFRR_006930 [Megaselia abdita]